VRQASRWTPRRRLELFGTLCHRQLILRRQRSVLGLIYPVFAPLLVLAMYTFLFKGIFDVPIRGYAGYLFIGLLPWTFFTQSMYQSLQSISSEAELLRRAPFPTELLPISTVVVNAGPFLVLLTGSILYGVYSGQVSVELVPFLLIPLLALALIAVSGALILALVDVYNHDLRYVLANLLQFWFFLVPIVYRPDMVRGKLRALRSIDPMNMIVGQMRDVLYYGHFSRPLNSALMLGVCGVVFLLSVMVFRRVAPILPRDV
jgi:lipopolysaccharide transport system permease protein